MRIRVTGVELELQSCCTRIPFRFGVHTLTEAPMAVVKLSAETSDGTPLAGWSSELLVPRWFEKDLDRSVEDDINSLVDSIGSAGEILRDGTLASVFDHYWRMFESRVLSVPVTAVDRLTRGFGCAIWERAMMDAACRGVGLPFISALDCDLFRIDPSRFHPELASWNFEPAGIPEKLAVRHTIGLLDELETRSPDAPEDGLPVTLVEDIRRHGLHWFKIKVGGDPQQDLERLRRIAAILCREADPNFKVTLDGNEQYPDPDLLAGVIQELGTDSVGQKLVDAIVSFEQPVPRSLTFDEATAPTSLAALAPVIIDEADHGPEAFPEALRLGYRGVSAKNCKGVSRSIAHQGICEVRAGGAFLSAEDLTNLPPWGLHQDLLTVAALGLGHVERNGHHYFRGLDHLPDQEAKELLSQHPDLYRPLDRSGELTIEAGQLSIGSLDCEGYGTVIEPAPSARQPFSEDRTGENG
ncbi:MAG: enolase C-terminal domain-like protein [Planctomycetota bacterium]|nr:enolase C-terminal domain-like protein [Planctomycetota bacterium]